MGAAQRNPPTLPTMRCTTRLAGPAGRLLTHTARLVLPLVAVLGALALGLKLLDAALAPAPGVISFASVGEAERYLGRELPVPAYFPDYLSWPPAGIEVRRQPDFLLSVRFTAGEGQVRGLDIYEAESRSALPPLPPGAKVSPDEAVLLKGVEARLAQVEPAGAPPYWRLEWQERSRSIVLETVYPKEEVLRMGQTLVGRLKTPPP